MCIESLSHFLGMAENFPAPTGICVNTMII